MLRRAWIWLVMAVVAGFFGYCEILGNTVAFARVFSSICLGFSVLSLLLSLFEEGNAGFSRKPGRQLRELRIPGFERQSHR